MAILARNLKNKDDQILVEVLKAMNETISILSRAREYFTEEDYSPLFPDEVNLTQSCVKIGRQMLSPSEMSLELFILAAGVANFTDQEEMCYEFYVEAFTVYEELISESKQQFNAIQKIIHSLLQSVVFGYENYETLITKALIHSSRLLKRADQCKAILLASNLFFPEQSKRNESKPAMKNSKKVLECLQKALKIADSVMDPALSVGLFVDILEEYLLYHERNFFENCQYINSLIELIQNTLQNPIKSAFNVKSPMAAKSPRKEFKVDVVKTAIHFTNILAFLRKKQGERVDSMPGLEDGFQRGKWADIRIPVFDFSNLHHLD
jgi:vacuolar protein sorting-associated protein 35